MMTTHDVATRTARELLDLHCALCGKLVPMDSSGVNIGDIRYHEGCAPQCATCGRALGNGAIGWVVQGEVVSVPWGYSVRPIRLWCPACLETAPRDEPAALD